MKTSYIFLCFVTIGIFSPICAAFHAVNTPPSEKREQIREYEAYRALMNPVIPKRPVPQYKKVALYVTPKPSKHHDAVVFIRPPVGSGEEILDYGVMTAGYHSVNSAPLVSKSALFFSVLPKHKSNENNTEYRIAIFAPNRKIEQIFEQNAQQLIKQQEALFPDMNEKEIKKAALKPSNQTYQELLQRHEAAYRKLDAPVIQFLLPVGNENNNDEKHEVTVYLKNDSVYRNGSQLESAFVEGYGDVCKLGGGFGCGKILKPKLMPPSIE